MKKSRLSEIEEFSISSESEEDLSVSTLNRVEELKIENMRLKLKCFNLETERNDLKELLRKVLRVDKRGRPYEFLSSGSPDSKK